MHRYKSKFLSTLLMLAICMGIISVPFISDYAYAYRNYQVNLASDNHQLISPPKEFNIRTVNDMMQQGRRIQESKPIILNDTLDMVTITGTISLPKGEVAPEYGIELFVKAYSYNYLEKVSSRVIYIPEGSNSAQYSIQIPKNHPISSWIVEYEILESDNFISKGYYNINGTEHSRQNATIININENDIFKNIDMVLLTSSKIMGTISMPEDHDIKNYSEYIRLSIYATSVETGHTFSEVNYIDGETSIDYTLNIPNMLSDLDWLVGYRIHFNNTSYSYISEGYYSTNGTVTDASDATPVSFSNGYIQDINIELVKSDDLGESKNSLDLLIEDAEYYDIGSVKIFYYDDSNEFYEEYFDYEISLDQIESSDDIGSDTIMSISGLDWDLADTYYIWIICWDDLLSQVVTKDNINSITTVDKSNLNATVNRLAVEISDSYFEINGIYISYITPEGDAINVAELYPNYIGKVIVRLPAGRYGFQIVAQDRQNEYNLFVEDMEIVEGENEIIFTSNDLTKINIEMSNSDSHWTATSFCPVPKTFYTYYWSPTYLYDKNLVTNKIDFTSMFLKLVNEKGYEYTYLITEGTDARNGLTIVLDEDYRVDLNLDENNFKPGQFLDLYELQLKDSRNNIIRNVSDTVLQNSDLLKWNISFVDENSNKYENLSYFNRPTVTLPHKEGLYDMILKTQYTGNRSDIPLSANKTLNTQIYIGNSSSIPVKNISLDYSNIVLNVGNEYRLEATVYPKNATNKSVTWELIEGNAIELDMSTGKVTALTPGVTKVRVTTEDGYFTDECTITVIDLSVEQPNGGRTIQIDEEFYTWDYLWQNKELLSAALNQEDIQVLVKIKDNIFIDKNGNLVYKEPDIDLFSVIEIY